MPNWCWTKSCFIGNKEDIERFNKDIENSIEWYGNNDYKYTNISHLLELNDFYTNQYNNSPNVEYSMNFRGSVIYNPKDAEKRDNGEYAIYPEFETAWNTDYNVLHLLSRLYNLKFSAYSEEPSMGVYTKCRNCADTTNDYICTIIPDGDQLDEHDLLDDIPYTIPVKLQDTETLDMIKLLNERHIDYNTYEIFEDFNKPKLYGVYYDTSAE